MTMTNGTCSSACRQTPSSAPDGSESPAAPNAVRAAAAMCCEISALCVSTAGLVSATTARCDTVTRVRFASDNVSRQAWPARSSAITPADGACDAATAGSAHASITAAAPNRRPAVEVRWCTVPCVSRMNVWFWCSPRRLTAREGERENRPLPDGAPADHRRFEPHALDDAFHDRRELPQCPDRLALPSLVPAMSSPEP